MAYFGRLLYHLLYTINTTVVSTSHSSFNSFSLVSNSLFDVDEAALGKFLGHSCSTPVLNNRGLTIASFFAGIHCHFHFAWGHRFTVIGILFVGTKVAAAADMNQHHLLHAFGIYLTSLK